MTSATKEIDWQSLYRLHDISNQVEEESASVTMWPAEPWGHGKDLALVASMPHGLHPALYQAASVYQISQLIFELFCPMHVAGQSFMQWMIHEASQYDGRYSSEKPDEYDLAFARDTLDMLLWNLERLIGPVFASECKVSHGLYEDPRSFIRIQGTLFAFGIKMPQE